MSSKTKFQVFLDEEVNKVKGIYYPVKAGICRQAVDYPFSSAKDYFNGGGISETVFAEEMTGREALLAYLKEPSDEECMDDDDCTYFAAARKKPYESKA